MSSVTTLRHEFVEYIPEALKAGTVYISLEYATAVHKCCCGCRKEVVTPLSPTDWRITFDGVSVSLDPSIGNWNFPCQSHYWIRRDKVVWADSWSSEEIRSNRRQDRKKTKKHYRKKQSLTLPKLVRYLWRKFD